MDRRRFLVGTVGAGTAILAAPWIGTAAAATEDELATHPVAVEPFPVALDLEAASAALERYLG